MKKFKLISMTSSVRKLGGGFIPTGDKFAVIHTDAEELLKPIFDRYDQDPSIFLSRIESGLPASPWAFVCFDKDYPIAGHVTTFNPENSGIQFRPLAIEPNPIPLSFVPKVGIMIIQNKTGVEAAEKKSLLFSILWEYLKDCSSKQQWIVIADLLPKDWLSQVTPTNDDLWLASR